MPAILSALLFEDAVGGVDGGSGGVNVQINEKWIGESGYNMGVPDLKASAGAQHAGRLDNGQRQHAYNGRFAPARARTCQIRRYEPQKNGRAARNVQRQVL